MRSSLLTERKFRNDVFGAVKLTFRQLSKGVLTYSSRPADGIPLLENALVEVSNKRSGGNPKVRVSSSAVDTSYVALITVTDSDGTAHYIRLVRCACCAEENDGWFPLSRQKSIVTVAALPFSLRYIRDELRRRHEVLAETKRRVSTVTVVKVQQILHRSKVKPPTRTSPRRVNKRQVLSKVLRSERERWESDAAKKKRRFFRSFKSLEGNETRVKSWLEKIRHPNSHLSVCDEGGDVFDYIDQLKALMQDMSMILDKMSRWMDMNDRDEEIRTLIWRLGLLDAKFSYRSLGYTKVGVGEYQDVAEFAYLFSGHVREFLIELSFPDYNYVEGFLLRDAMAIRYWIGQRWVRLGQTWHAPLCAKYKFEPRSGDGNFVDLPYEFSVVFDQ
ncbi:hypothetical protein AAVH_27007 [Aphelenchoides avenae]|nr:hypothetical protein AAVH_27007 [Aphelenchus avenae]